MSIQSRGYWYLAAPYTIHPDGIEEAFRIATEAAGRLALAGVMVFSPITHSHPIAIRIQDRVDPLDHEFWLTLDEPLMDGAKGMILLVLPELSYGSSRGIAREIARFRQRGKPILTYELPPEDVNAFWWPKGLLREHPRVKRCSEGEELPYIGDLAG